MKLSSWTEYVDGDDPSVFATREGPTKAVGHVERVQGGILLCTTPVDKPVRFSKLKEVAGGTDVEIFIEVDGKVASVDQSAGGGGWMTGDELVIVAC
jgi:hypothetical protein